MITDPLLFRFLAGEATVQEQNRVNSWLDADPANRQHLDKLREILETPGDKALDQEMLSAWIRLSARMDLVKTKPSHQAPRKLRFIRAAAAVMLILISSGLFFYLSSEGRVYRNNDLITKSFLLSDGTQVYLGPASRIKTSRDFNQEHREVRIIGQAFFNVNPDPEHPFMVLAGDTRVEVSGTQFSVTAPKKTGEVEVSVHSGQVLFYNSQIVNKNAFRMGLGPGDMGIYSPSLRRMDKTRDPLYYSAP